MKYDIFIRFGLAISAFLCILPLVIQACALEFWQKKKVLRHVVNCVIVFPSLILTMWLGFKYMNPSDAYNEASNSIVPVSIYNSDGDVIQTFTGRLGSIKYGDGYVRYVDEDNVEHNIYLNDYAVIGIGEVIE